MSNTETEIVAHARQEHGTTKKARSPQKPSFFQFQLFIAEAIYVRPIMCIASFVRVPFPFAYRIHAQEKI